MQKAERGFRCYKSRYIDKRFLGTVPTRTDCCASPSGRSYPDCVYTALRFNLGLVLKAYL